MKIAFFGTSAFGIPTLKKLYQNFGVEFIVTGQAKPAHRGKKIVNTPIFELGKSLGIQRVYTPEKLTQEFQEYLKDIDYAVVVSYGKILPVRILESVKGRFINLHPSKLPLFRGAAPIERTIEIGQTETDICVINMEKELDAGSILAQKTVSIDDNENSITLHEKFSEIGADLIIDLIQNGVKMEIPQDHTLATYAHKITKEELALEFTTEYTSKEIFNKIRAFASYGFCYVIFYGKRFKFIRAQISKIQLTPIDIKCTDGFVSPLVIRPEGKGDIKICDYQF